MASGSPRTATRTAPQKQLPSCKPAVDDAVDPIKLS
jgi:hypothetical protein